MKCPRCGKTNPVGAAFCMHCGQPAPAAQVPRPMPVATSMPGGAAVATPLSGAFDAHRKRNAAVAAIVALVAMLGAGIIGAHSLGLLRLGDKLPGAGALKAAATQGPSGLKQVAQLGPPGLQKMAIGMPADVEDWLKHLQETERRKRILTARQYNELTQMQSVMELGVTTPQQVQQLTDPDQMMDKTPDNEALQDLVKDAKPAWYRLNDFLLSKPAPPECKAIESNYSEGLCQIGDTMGDIASIVDSVNPMSPDLNGDIASSKKDLYQIQQTHRETVDEAFKKALYGVDDVCKKYNRKRWFDIDTSGGGSDILGKYIGGGGPSE